MKRNITGETGSTNFDNTFPTSGPFYKGDKYAYPELAISKGYYDNINWFDASRTVPTSIENKPVNISMLALINY